MENSNIEWTTHTFNAWIGCQKVSAGCDHCYAEDLTRRWGSVEWGPHGKRKRTSDANWRKPIQWNRKAIAAGERHRVFCASLADVFDNKAPAGARDDLFELIKATPGLDWLLLTKRPENIARFLPDDWGPDGYANVWLGTTTEDQTAYDRRWPRLRANPAPVYFISYEPAIGPLTLQGFGTAPDWLIWGGESGNLARPMDPQWARDITAECLDRGVAVFGKQWGQYRSNPFHVEAGLTLAEAARRDPKTNGKGGALLDGHLYRQFPVRTSPAEAQPSLF